MFLADLTRKLASKKKQEAESPKNIVRKYFLCTQNTPWILDYSKRMIRYVKYMGVLELLLSCRNNNRQHHKCFADKILKKNSTEERLAYEN